MLYTNKDSKWPDNLLQISIVRDEYLSNPCDDVGSWQVHDNFIGTCIQDVWDSEEYRNLAQQGFAYLVCEVDWDTLGIVDNIHRLNTFIVYWPHPVDDMGAITPEDRKKDCEAFLKCYADYIYGNGLGYVIKDSNNEESCYGYYEHDIAYILFEIKALLPQTPLALLSSVKIAEELIAANDGALLPGFTYIVPGPDHLDYIDLRDILK